MAATRKGTSDGLTHGHPCHACGATCCRYVGIALERPRGQDDRDLIHWYLSHKNLCIYVDKDGDWWIQVDTDCRHIAPDGGCGIYERRPQLCRNYQAATCERADAEGDNIAEFTTVEEFERFFELNYRVVGDKLRRKHRTYRAPSP
jgi:Fe-S-cluster containining protein